MTDLAFADRKMIEAHQLAALRDLLREVIPANPFQAKHLRATDVDAGIESLGSFIKQCPFTTKDDLVRDQDLHPPYGTNLTYALERYTRLHQTSSTTGMPLRWLDTNESWCWMLDGWEMILRVAGVGAGDRVLAAFSFGPFIGFWMGFEAACRVNCLAIPGGGLNSVTRLRVILANDVTVLLCTPTYAIHLGEVARGEGIDLARSSVRVIIVAGEPGGSVPATRARIESLWPGARIFDHHGMTEVGPVTYQCPDHPGILHINEGAYLAEVIDTESGASLEPGSDKVGELVLTPLGRAASPVLRYRTGDLVRPVPAGRCGCGRTFAALEGGIIARLDDMVFIRGVNMYPSAVEEIIRNCGGVAEYRCEISDDRALAEMKVLIEPEPDISDPDRVRKALEKAFRDAYSLRVPVELAARGALPRFELKARRWVRTSKDASA